MRIERVVKVKLVNTRLVACGSYNLVTDSLRLKDMIVATG